ncbi:hypothetical protein D3C86_1826690 [compost metagenome]
MEIHFKKVLLWARWQGMIFVINYILKYIKRWLRVLNARWVASFLKEQELSTLLLF